MEEELVVIESDDIEETLLNQLLYNAIAFYQNCYNKNYEAIAPICTDDLNAAIANNSGSSTGNGVDIIFNMSQYFTYTDPVSLQAVYDGHFGDYIVYINVSYKTRQYYNDKEYRSIKHNETYFSKNMKFFIYSIYNW